MDRAKTTARRDKKHLSFEIWCVLYKRFYGGRVLTKLLSHVCMHSHVTLPYVETKLIFRMHFEDASPEDEDDDELDQFSHCIWLTSLCSKKALYVPNIVWTRCYKASISPRWIWPTLLGSWMRRRDWGWLREAYRVLNTIPSFRWVLGPISQMIYELITQISSCS